MFPSQPLTVSCLETTWLEMGKRGSFTAAAQQPEFIVFGREPRSISTEKWKLVQPTGNIIENQCWQWGPEFISHPFSLIAGPQSAALFFFFFFNWGIVLLQCCVSFYCTEKWSSPCYTAGSYSLSILYILVYICQSQSPSSSHHYPSLLLLNKLPG